jgi:hypothetical protein
MLLSLPAAAPLAADLTAAEERGKYIYEEGRSRSRRVIMADMQRGELTPGHILPCINCHGADGRGAEDYVGVAPLNVNWYALASSGTHQHSLRSHSPFDEKSLARAIVLGKDPDGSDMDKAMPRYDMAQEDVEDLIAYLKVMDSQSDPAISGRRARGRHPRNDPGRFRRSECPWRRQRPGAQPGRRQLGCERQPADMGGSGPGQQGARSGLGEPVRAQLRRGTGSACQ